MADLLPIFPSPPPPPFEVIPSRNCPVGARVILFAQSRSQISPQFKADCERVDVLREQVRNSAQLTLDLVPHLSEYAGLVTKLTNGLNLTNQGVGVNFLWRQKTCSNEVDFDICCLSFNVCVGLLATASRLVLNSNAVAQEYNNHTKHARTICDRIVQLYRDGFRDGLTREAVESLSSYINAYFLYGLAAFSSLRQPKGLMTAKIAKTAANAFPALAPPQTDISLFLLIFADVTYSRAENAAENYGNAIAVGKNAFLRFQQLPKKMNPVYQGSSKQLLDGFKPEYDELVRRNTKIYFSPVPEYGDVPASKAPPCPVVDDFWNSASQAEDILESSKAAMRQELDETVAAIERENAKAVTEIETAVQAFPAAVVKELADMVAALYSQRTLAHQLRDEISRNVGARPDVVFRRMPDLNQRLAQWGNALAQAANVDLSYETIYGKAKNSIAGMEKCYQDLLQAKDAFAQSATLLQDVVRKANTALEAAEIDAVLAGHQEMKQAFAGLNTQLEPTRAQVTALAAKMQTEVDTKLQEYFAHSQSVRTGFQKATDFYGKLIRQYQNVRDTINSL
jgi:hypothetical protein